MRLIKKMKKAFAIVLATALMIPSTGIIAGADETATTAYISFSDSAWAVQSWNAGTKDTTEGIVHTNAEVTGYGQYTVAVDVSGAKDADGNALTATDLAFFDVEITNGEAAYPNSFMTIDSVKINGEEVELASPTYTSSDDDVVTRTNLFNEWVGDATTVKNARTADGSNEGITASPVAKEIGAFTSIEVTFTLGEGKLCNGVSEAVLSEESYPAFIAIGADKAESGDWGLGYYGADVEGVTAVNGELKSGETTTLSLTFDEPVLYTWFVSPCMVIDNPTWVSAEQSTFDVKVYLDGVEVAVDMSAGDICWAEATGDYAENCLRIAGGYNEWGTHYLAESPAGFKEIKFEITPQIYIAEPSGPDVPEFDPEGTYNAYIGFQTPKYSFRNAWDDADYGKETDFFNQVTGWDEENNALSLGGTFTDAVINGNGTYTVKVEGFDDWTADFADQDTFNLLFLSTDLPNSEDVVISNIILKMDGSEITTVAEPILDEDAPVYQKISLANTYNNDIPELPYYAVPTKSIEITFTVSGFANDAVVETPDDGGEETPEATPTTAPSEDKKDDASTDTSADAAKDDKDGGNTGLIIGIVAAVVVAAGVVIGVVSKKKKK